MKDMESKKSSLDLPKEFAQNLEKAESLGLNPGKSMDLLNFCQILAKEHPPGIYPHPDSPQEGKLLLVMPQNMGRTVVPVATVIGIINMILYAKEHLPKVQVHFRFYPGCLAIDQGRNESVHYAQACGYTHLLFLDDDMTFPEDTIVTLWKGLSKNQMIISGLYAAKQIPPHFFLWDNVNGAWSRHYKKDPPLQASTRIATGCLLIDMQVFTLIPEPWFLLKKDTKGRLTVTEDVYFGIMAVRYGMMPYVYTPLLCGHIWQVEWPKLLEHPGIRCIEEVDFKSNCPIGGNIVKGRWIDKPESVAGITIPVEGTSFQDGLIECAHKVQIKREDVSVCAECGLVLTVKKPERDLVSMPQFSKILSEIPIELSRNSIEILAEYLLSRFRISIRPDWPLKEKESLKAKKKK